MKRKRHIAMTTHQNLQMTIKRTNLVEKKRQNQIEGFPYDSFHSHGHLEMSKN